MWQLETFSAKNFGVLRDFSVDLTSEEYAGQRLVAVTGVNGAGKTTFLELAGPGILYRETPSRGGIAGLSVARDSFLESRLVGPGGRRLTIRHLVDAVSGKGESVVLDESGKPLLDSAKVSDFDAFIAREFPPASIFYATLFGAQQSAGFVGAKPTERKSLLLRALGIEHLEAMAKSARDRSAEFSTKVSSLRAAIKVLSDGAPNLDELQAQVGASRLAIEGSRSAVAVAENEAQLARLAAADATLALTRWRERSESKAAAEAKATSLRAKLEDLRTRAKNNEQVIARAEEIRSAVSRLEALRAELAETEAAITEAGREEEAIARELSAARAEFARCEKETARLENEVRALEPRESEAALVARRSIEKREATDALQNAEFEFDELSKRQLTGAGDRIFLLRRGLEAVRDSGDSTIAGPVLERDDVSARAAEEHPRLVSAAREALESARRADAAARAALVKAEEAQRAVAKLQELREALALAVTAELSAKARVGQAESFPLRDTSDFQSSRSALLEEKARLEPVAKLAEPLASAEARLSELAPQLEAAELELASVTESLSTFADLGEQPGEGDAKAAEDRLRIARATLASAESSLASLETSLAEARSRATKVATLSEELSDLQLDHEDWMRLAADLGKDGLQALEIDAAGPELTAVANNLLHTCFGVRFSVEISTTRQSADGKKQIEGCDILVTDTVEGRTGPIEGFSGGERVILGEAVSLALTTIACRRFGIGSGVTLVRDETGAALSAENAAAYVAMLRLAADHVGAKQVLFVSHNPLVIELADARIEMGAAS